MISAARQGASISKLAFVGKAAFSTVIGMGADVVGTELGTKYFGPEVGRYVGLASGLLAGAAAYGGLDILDREVNFTGAYPKTVTGGGNKLFVDSPFDAEGNLRLNVQYQSGEHPYYYETDSMGRVQIFNTDDLQRTERIERLSYNPNTPGKLSGDQAGHLAGDRFGGSPDIDNLVSQSSDVNLSQYKRLENIWAKAIDEGKQVSVKVEVQYNGVELRPSGFKVSYIINGDSYFQYIPN